MKRKKNAVVSEFKKKLDARVIRDRVAGSATLSLKEFMLSPDFAAPFMRATTPAGAPLLTPVAEAIVDAIDGNQITTITDEVCRRILGCSLAEMNQQRAVMYVLSGGGRSGKTTRFLVCVCAWLAWTVPVKLAPGQEAYAAISAPGELLSARAKAMVAGLIMASPVMSTHVVGSAVEKTLLRRPDGTHVAIIVAIKGELAGRAGSFVFFGVDEGEYFPQDGSPNDLEKMVSGARQRVLPGGMIAIVSTPRVEAEGFMQRTIIKERGRHRTALVVELVWTSELNPHWDPDGKKESDDREAFGDVDADCEYLAIPKPRGMSKFVDMTWLDDAKKLVIPHDDNIVQIGAGSDLGMVQDGSDLYVVARHVSGRFSIRAAAHARPINGPLVPSVVCSEFAVVARGEDAWSVAADIHYAETYKEHLATSMLTLVPCPTGIHKYGVYMAMRQVFATGRISFGPGLSKQEIEDLCDQLMRLVERRSASGVRVELPRRVIRSEADAAGAKRDHCDGAAALALGLWSAGAGSGAIRQPGSPVSIPQEQPKNAAPVAPPKVRGVSFATGPKVRGWGR
jgi:hypothetical protein